MNIQSFLQVFTNVFIVLGVLLLPFNTLIPGFLICLRFNLHYPSWMAIVKRLWVLQILWNLVFFSIYSSLDHIDKGKTSYTLIQKAVEKWAPNDPQRYEWEYHFYTNGATKKEIPDNASNATPFQEAMAATGYISEGKGLDPHGLHASQEEIDGGQTGLILAFNELSYAQATAYIDHLNASRATSGGEGFFVTILAALVAPFIWLIPELMVACIIACPLTSAIVLGPSLLRILNTLGFFAAIGGAFRSRA